MISDTKVTILTPTYNRAHTLPQLYNSLLRQSDKRFSWVIVDDGSSDATREVVSGFAANFPLKYIYKQNAGKHTAINCGMQSIDSEFTFIVDSDDYLKDNAIELINRWIVDIAGVTGLAGVAGLSVDEENKVMGQFPNNCEYIDCFNSERKLCKLLGDKAEVYKTELLKSHPFPVYEDERFMPESIVWNQFSLEGLKVRWYKDCIKVCKYLEDGLTSATKNIDYFKKNYKGYRDDYALNLKVFRFPYNYLSVSVFYARCKAIKRTKGCFDNFEVNIFEKNLITLLGEFRYFLGRF